MKCKNCGADITSLYYFTKKKFCCQKCEDAYNSSHDFDFVECLNDLK